MILAPGLADPASTPNTLTIVVLVALTACTVVALVFLAREVTWRTRSEAALKALREDFESQVEARTRKLSEANRKLEADLALYRQIEGRLRELATVDELTGLFNRREFDRLLADEVRRNRRYGHPLSLVLADIDYFKAANDKYGHQVGDAMLRRIAQIVRGALRATDRVARYGGEEIGIILPETDEGDAYRVAEHLRKLIASAPLAVSSADGSPEEVHLSVSFGVAGMSPRILSREDLVLAADSALYQAKAGGRNRTEYFNGKLISGPLPEDLWPSLPVVPAEIGQADRSPGRAGARVSHSDPESGPTPAPPMYQGPDHWST